MTVNERIRKEMLARGWSQYELAKRAKMQQSTISKWFQSVPTTPSSRSLKKVAKAFDMPIGELLEEKKAPDAVTKEMYEYWLRLNLQEKKSVLQIIKSIVAHR